ncbi:MAG: transglutaminase domain-containing protein [Deltaproteobacteria bacterium]|nr:transglutaminase domain-containing protein [Deltaproteobacteria bacterium]
MGRLFPLILAFFLGLIPSAALAGPQSGTITMEFDLTSHQPGKDAQLWIPYPVSDGNQLIKKIRITGDFAESAVYTDREYGTPMLYARWDGNAKSRKLTFSFTVEREERLTRDLPAGEAPWDPANFALYLKPTRLGPTDGEIRKLADSITAGRMGVRDQARAIYDWVSENMFRDPNTRGCGSGDVDSLLNSLGGKCADISSVFVALTRAAGVPSREVFGIRLGKGGTTDITKWQHCWAEYYLPGYGWVVVDPADVLKMVLKEKLDAGDAKTAEYREYFWGGVDPYRVKLGEGRDLTLNPPQSGGPVNYLMYPYAQIGGKTLDWLDPDSFRYRISYTAG